MQTTSVLKPLPGPEEFKHSAQALKVLLAMLADNNDNGGYGEAASPQRELGKLSLSLGGPPYPHGEQATGFGGYHGLAFHQAHPIVPPNARGQSEPRSPGVGGRL